MLLFYLYSDSYPLPKQNKVDGLGWLWYTEFHRGRR